MSAKDESEPGEVYAFALAEVSKVLGPDRGLQLITRLLNEHEIDLRPPEDLVRLAEVSRLGGFEGAVGAMLRVAGVLRGASASREKLSA